MILRKKLFITFGIGVGILVVAISMSDSNNTAENNVALRLHYIDKHGSESPWGKAVGDINQDGLIDLVVGGNKSEDLYWYQAPNWKKHLVAKGHRFSTAHLVADIDGDGVNDIVSLSKKAIMWFKGSDWQESIIAPITLHDVEAADLDHDGDLDLVARNQSAFADGQIVYIFEQVNPQTWRTSKLKVPHGEGLAVADLDGDGYMDIVVNARWYRNTYAETIPGSSISPNNWSASTFSNSWDWPHTYIDVADINGDGNPDIVLSPAEKEGQFYHISWFESPGITGVSGIWTEHIVLENVEAVHHYIGAADLDNDSDVDLLTAEMHQGKDPDEVAILLNLGKGQHWRKQLVSENGSHSIKLFDQNGDGDVDFFGANWSGSNQTIQFWENLSCDDVGNEWIRHEIDDSRPWKSIFITAADINHDKLPDIITGGWWYQNPGVAYGKWRRHTIGGNLNNMAAVFDIDHDGDLDVLGTKGEGADANGEFIWASNTDGQFTKFYDVAETKGDFLQGVAVNAQTVALSWHQAGHGIHLLTTKPSVNGSWPLTKISNESQDEALSAGDIDADGDMDLVMGTKWLENQDGSWQSHVLFNTKNNPDRNRLADINGDGRLDVIIGYEAISTSGTVAWYEAGADVTQLWQEHIISNVTGPMSLDVADMDGDGDIDVVVGEHNLKQPHDARMLIYLNDNGRWKEKLVYRGDEHHDGAQTVDIDGDGDLDIISIGWEHNKVVLYENRKKFCSTVSNKIVPRSD